MSHNSFITALFALFLGVLGGVSSAVLAASPESGQLVFDVMRKGDLIGSHKMLFTRADGDLKIDIKTDIKVKILFATVYRFEHDGHEVWRDGRLQSMQSKTNDDGTPHEMSMIAKGTELQVTGDGVETMANAEIIPASLWHEGILKGGKILNTLDGRQMAIAVEDMGEETIKTGNNSVAARHYVISGELERDLWYNSDQILVQIAFEGDDGSDILYQLHD